MDFASEIKSRVDCKAIFEFYGFSINRAGFCRCPFHGEKTASMKVYDGDRGYHCFGCNESGDAITFVQKYFSVGFHQAVQKLNEDFGLGLPIGEQIDRRKRLEMEKAAFLRRKKVEQERKNHEQLEDEYNRRLAEFAAVDRIRIQYAPKRGDRELHPEFVRALSRIGIAEYYLDESETELYLYEHASHD